MRLSHLIAASTLLTGIFAFVLGIAGFMVAGKNPTGFGEAVYRSLQMFVGTFTYSGPSVGLLSLLGLARLLAIWSTLVVTITTVTSLLGFSADPWRAHKARRHVVIIGDRPELDSLAAQIALPHLDAKGSPRDKGWEAIATDWPCGSAAPVVRIAKPQTQSLRVPGIRTVDRTRETAVRRALKDATRVVVGCVGDGDTIRTVRDVMESELSEGATVHVLASNALRQPIEASSNKRSKPVILDAFSIEGRAVSLLFSKLRVEPEWSILAVTPNGALGNRFAAAMRTRCPGQIEAGTFGHVAAEQVGQLGTPFQWAVRDVIANATDDAPSLMVVIAGYADSDVLAVESACRRNLHDLSGTGRSAPANFSWGIALITGDRLGTVSDKSSISTAMILSDPQDLAETTLMRVASRVAPTAAEPGKVADLVTKTIGSLDGWYLERIPIEDVDSPRLALSAVGSDPPAGSTSGPPEPSIAEYDGAALAAMLDALADKEIRRLADDLTILPRKPAPKSKPGPQTESDTEPEGASAPKPNCASESHSTTDPGAEIQPAFEATFTSFRNLLALCGEPYRKRPIDRTTFQSRLATLARNSWTAVDYAALGVPIDTNATKTIAPDVETSATLRANLVDTFSTKVAELLGCAGTTIPSATPRETKDCGSLRLGLGFPHWWRPTALKELADRLVSDDPRMGNPGRVDAFETYFAALLVLECVPIALRAFGLTLSDSGSTFSEQQVWVGAHQVHGEYERRFGDARDPAAFTCTEWDRSRHSYRSDNFDGSLRALGYIAFLERFPDPSGTQLWQISDRIAAGKEGRVELKALLGTLPDSVRFVTTSEHDRWSIGKMQNRWRYARTRSDHLHLHTDLKPWDMLCDGERIKDLNVVLTADRIQAAIVSNRLV